MTDLTKATYAMTKSNPSYPLLSILSDFGFRLRILLCVALSKVLQPILWQTKLRGIVFPRLNRLVFRELYSKRYVILLVCFLALCKEMFIILRIRAWTDEVQSASIGIVVLIAACAVALLLRHFQLGGVILSPCLFLRRASFHLHADISKVDQLRFQSYCFETLLRDCVSVGVNTIVLTSPNQKLIRSPKIQKIILSQMPGAKINVSAPAPLNFLAGLQYVINFERQRIENLWDRQTISSLRTYMKSMKNYKMTVTAKS